MKQFQLALYVIILGTIWGLNFSLMKIAALSGLPYALLGALVIFGNLLIFLAFCWLFFGRIRFFPQLWWLFAGCGALGYLLPFFMELFAVPRTGAGTLAVVVSLSPIFTLLFAALFRVERLTPKRLAGITLGFLSILPIALQDISALQQVFGLGLVIGVLIPICYALYHVFIAQYWPDEVEPFEVALGESLASMILMVPVYALWSDPDTPLHTISLWQFWIVGALLVFSALEVWLYFQLMRMGGPTYASQAGYVTVITGVLWAGLFFGEGVTLWLLLSIAMVFAALLLTGSKEVEDVASVENAS